MDTVFPLVELLEMQVSVENVIQWNKVEMKIKLWGMLFEIKTS